MRITCSVQRKKRKDKILALAKGFYGRKRHCYGLAIDSVRRKFVYEYRDRRRIKRQMRSLWIQRLSAAAKMIGLSYSILIHKLKQVSCLLNRKMLSEMAAKNFEHFKNAINSLIGSAEKVSHSDTSIASDETADENISDISF